MKNLLLLFLLAFICPIYGQNTDEIIQQIRTDYDLIQNELLSKSKKVVIGTNFIKFSKFLLIEDEFADLKFDCIGEVCNRVFELYFHQDSADDKWNLVKITSQSSFGEGFEVMRTEAAYYFSHQQLIFHYLVELNDSNGEEADEGEHFHRRSEHRYYYHDGQIIKYLYKDKELLLGSKPSEETQLQLEELMLNIPSKEKAIPGQEHFDGIRKWANELIEDWGHGAELIK